MTAPRRAGAPVSAGTLVDAIGLTERGHFTVSDVDGGKRLRDRIAAGDLPGSVVVVAGSDAFHRVHAPTRTPDVAILKLWDDDVPAAFRWPALPDTVEARVEDAREQVIRALVAVLFGAGALVVEVFALDRGRLAHFVGYARGDSR